MTMSGDGRGAVLRLSHAQSGPVCSASVEVEFVNVCAPLNLNSYKPRGLPKISQR